MPENVNKICKVCGDNCDCGRYIGKYFDAEKYNTYMSITDTIQKQIAAYLFKQLEIEKCKGEMIEIFTAGVGPGRIEIPFLYKCLNDGNSINLKLTAVDLDTGMLRKFYDNINEYFKECIDEKEKHEVAEDASKDDGSKQGIHYFSLNIKNKKNSIKIEAFCGNLENLHKKNYYTNSHYDYIFSIFVLHAITNWEEPLYHLLRMLKPGGKIVFAEEIGDVNWLDNHFNDIEKHSNTPDTKKDERHYYKRLSDEKVKLHRKFWKEYHHVRKEGLGKEWAKDTKASNLGVIEVCFQKMQDLGLVENSSSNKESSIFTWEAKEQFTFNQLLKWVKGEEQLYTPLNYGLGSSRNKTAIEELEKKIDNQWDQWKNKCFLNIYEDIFIGKDTDIHNGKEICDRGALFFYMKWWLKKQWEEKKTNAHGNTFEYFLENLKISRIEGHKFHIYTKVYNKDKIKKENSDNTEFNFDNIIHNILYGNTISLYRLKERIAYETHRIPGLYKGEFPPRELTHRLFTLRDIYLRLFSFTHSIYVKWQLEDPTDPSKGNLDKRNMPILLTFPKGRNKYNDIELLKQIKQYLATYILYTWLTFKDETIKDFSFTDFVFREMPEKFSIIIKREENIGDISIHFSQVSSGLVNLLEICVPENDIKIFINDITFEYNGDKIDFNNSIDMILEKGDKLLDEFIANIKFHVFNNNQSNRFEYLDSALFYASPFLKLVEKIQALGFKKVDISDLRTKFESKFQKKIKKITDHFKDIGIYNNWPKEEGIPVERFLFTTVRTAVIGYGTKVGEWYSFAKYPGKSFNHNRMDNSREESMGGFIVMRSKVDSEKDKLERVFEKSHEIMLFLISGLWSRNDSILEWGRLMRKQGTKAAVAAIMGRNMSHNIGSHVLSNMSITNDNYKDHVSKFYAYLQGRMDFIARIATEWPLCATPMDFYLDIIKGFKEQYILLENILKSENLNRNRIEFIVTILGQEVCEKIELTTDKECNICGGGKDCNDVYKYSCITNNDHIINIPDLKNVLVNIPESSIGLQAFYSIMENFIRNSAKHGNKDIISSEGLKLYIKLQEGSFSDLNNDEQNKTKKTTSFFLEGTYQQETPKINKELYMVRIWDNISIITNNTKVDEMNNKLEGRLIKESGEVDEKDWGIKEMKISAAFLRRKDINEAEDNPKNFIKAISVNGTNEKKYLGYEFYLEKPKFMMIIDDVRDNKEESENYGIYFSKSLEDQVRLGIPYQFLFVNLSNRNEATIKIIEDNITKNDTLPYRLFGLRKDNNNININVPDNLNRINRRLHIISKNEIYQHLDIANQDLNEYRNAIVKAYETWIKKISSLDKYSIIIYFEEDDNNRVVTIWKTIASDINKRSSLIQLIILCKGDEQAKIEKIIPNSTIMFLRHGGTGLGEGLRGEIKTAKKNYLYYEQIEKASPIFEILWNTYNNIDVNIFLLKLIESALLKILIIDERVAQKTFAEKKQNGDINTEKEDNLALMGIMTATHIELQVGNCKKSLALSAEVENALKLTTRFCNWQDLRSVTFNKDNFVKAERYKAEGENKSIINGFHMIVIHQGVLDKLNNEENNFFITTHWGSVENFISELKQYIPFVIVDSGRGKPTNLPKNGKYIEYSVIQDWILRKPSKFHIINALMSITGKGEKNE